jgi:hypothetical protein
MLRAHAATAAAAARTDPATAAVISRLTPEFREQPGPRTVERIVLQARHDLDDLHPQALPRAVGTPRPTTPARDSRTMTHSALRQASAHTAV